MVDNSLYIVASAVLAGPVDENVASVFDDLLHFVLHLFLFCELEFCDFGHGIDANSRTENFDLIGIHRSVGDQNYRVGAKTIRIGT